MSEERTGAGKGLLSSALLVAAVSVTLLAGFVLRTSGRTAPPPVTQAPPPPISLPLGSAVTPEPEPASAPPADPLLMRLASRAEADAGRLAKAKGRWTAQLLVACKPETVDRVLAANAGASKLYVLPASVKDEACFRVCFGDYDTPKEAAAAADLPPALRGREKIGAAEIVKVLP